MNSKILLRKDKADIVTVKCLYKYPVPTAQELRAMLDTLPKFDPLLIALTMLASQALRPVELCDLHWDEAFTFNQNNDLIQKMKHMVYKAKNRMLMTGQTKVTYKELQKPMYSKWLSHKLLKYKEYFGECQGNKIFPWTTNDALNKFFTTARKSKNPKLTFMLDKNHYPLKGQDKTRYRIHPYALRRFAFTFHYWTTYNQDIVSLSRDFGHSRIETTMNYYVFPKESIGLTDEMIKNKITFDEFVFGKDKDQEELARYIHQEQVLPIRTPGQRAINEYILPS